MRERRFYVAELDGSTVRLSGPEHHHLTHVLRLREGDEVALFDGKGRSVSGRISRIDDSVAEVEVGVEVGANLASCESSLALRLAVVVPKGDRMTTIVQKATELGAVEVIPLVSARGEWDETAARGKLDRWQRIALEACKQSGRSVIPTIASPTSFGELVGSNEPSASTLWVAQAFEPRPALPPGVRDATICIGPEGGWAEDELELVRSHGATLFGLGPRILRTDTAATVAVALFQWLGGDLSASD